MLNEKKPVLSDDFLKETASEVNKEFGGPLFDQPEVPLDNGEE